MSVALAIFGIGLLIFIHELGHLWMARRVGIPVQRFSIGMGPVIWRRQALGLEWALSAVPFGGYVLFDGEDEAFTRASPVASILTSLAGPAANIVAAVFLYVAATSLQAGGFALADGLSRSWVELGNVFGVLQALFTGKVGVSDLAGPVHMVSIGSDLASDPARFLSYLGFISLDLAVLNLLPIPALDGGRILITAAQAITRRTLPQRAQVILLGGSFLLLVGLMLWVTVQDVVRVVS